MKLKEELKKPNSLDEDLDSMCDITREEKETFNNLSEEDQEEAVDETVLAFEQSF